MAGAEDVHEWISFEDPTEQRTWVFDATYLRSNHRCIYGEGCEGILDGPAADLAQGCCSYGAHFVDDACIFLNRPGFEGGTGCALHIAALEAGERPLDWKPNVCWQVPIRLEHTTDDNGHVTSRLREWKRRDWGDGGADFHWWCTEAPEAFSGAEPVYKTSRDEIVELVSKPIYDLMVEQLERPNWVPLPHPVVRNRT